MALVTTTGSLKRLYNAFTGLSATERSQSGIARAEIIYYNVNDTWPATGAVDNRLYQTGQITLPKDFGYVLTDARLLISAPGNDSLNNEAVAQYQLFPGGILGPQINGVLESAPSRMNLAVSNIGDIPASKYNTIYPSSAGNFGAMVFELTNKPTSILYPFGSQTYTSAINPGTVFNFSVSEQVTNQSARDMTLYIRFLQYDIDQTYNYVIQSPQLTR